MQFEWRGLWYLGLHKHKLPAPNCLWSAFGLAINPFWIILSNTGHIFHRSWLSHHLLWHSKLAEWEFQSALRRPKSLVIKMFRWFVPSEHHMGLLFIPVLPLCPFVHGLLGLCVWHKSEFSTFPSYFSIHLDLFPLGWTIWAKRIDRGLCKATSYFFLGKEFKADNNFFLNACGYSTLATKTPTDEDKALNWRYGFLGLSWSPFAMGYGGDGVPFPEQRW